MKLKSIFIIFLVIIWCGVIYVASDKTSDESNGKSKMIIYNFSRDIVYFTNSVGITNIELTDKWINERVSALNYPLRKCIHWIVYFILGILLIICFKSMSMDVRKCLFITILLCFIYSLTDEYHQTYIIGRTGQFSDCLIDTFGPIIGGFIMYLFFKSKEIKN